ncbi:Alpha/Beta hydrolase protein [Desarmillaria ectypa]|nr:Alpha/Beta hydrolase protein [Desarmillaria ectypa]
MPDPVLASPPADCCLDCFPHEGTPRGKWARIVDIETYILKPVHERNTNQIILYFPDVWGIDIFVNGQLLADYFASQGFTVLALDYFKGDSIQRHRKNRHDRTTNPTFDYEAWKQKHMAFADSNVPKWIDAVVEQFGGPDTKYAAVGYCFGAPYVMDMLLEGSLFCAGAFAHPAFLRESHFFACAKPLLLSCSEVDHTFPAKSRHRAEDILKEKQTPYHVHLFSGVEHGFALRGDMSDPYQRWVKEESADAIVRWFRFWMNSKRK